MAIQTLKYPPHKLALIFPRPSAEEQDKLTDHIRRNGLQEPVILFEGAILDGVSRATSCLKLGIQPRYCEFMHLSPEIKEAGPLAFVTGRNLVRRHLTPSQRAMVGAELLAAGKKMLAERTGMPVVIDEEGAAPKRGRGRPKGKRAEEVAAAMGVSTRSVERAARVLKENPRKAAAIKAGETTVAKEAEKLSATDMKKAQRAAALSRIALVCGEEMAEAVERGDRLKTHTDLMAFTAHPDEEMRQIGGLVDVGWSYKKAKLYKSKNITRRHTVDDLLNKAAAERDAKGVFETEIDGWAVTLKRAQ